MSAIEHKEFDRNLRPRERHFCFSNIALRKRSADHPMIMFFTVVAIAFTAMALVPPSGSAFASMGMSATAIVESAVNAAEPATMAGLSDTDIACSGQAWGAENVDCLATIAKASGRSDARKVRLIANAGAQSTTPNVF